jgi:transcriptional antiterminator RfaH
MKPQKLWFVVHTKPGQEETVAMHLKHKGIETYLPKIETCTYNGLKKIKKTKSLFPNYLFAGCERKNVPQVCWTRGVKKVLWENNAPQPIADELILSLKSLTDNDGLIRPARWGTYQKNDLVLITSGPFKDLYALFDHWESDKERVCLLLNILNAQIRVTVPAALLAVA